MIIELKEKPRIAWHRSVTLRLIAIVILCVGFAQGLALYLTTQHDNRAALLAFTRQYQNLLNANSEIIGSLVWTLQFDRLDRVLQSLLMEPAIVSVTVRDATGTIVSAVKDLTDDAVDTRFEPVVIHKVLNHSNDFINVVAGSVDLTLTTQYLELENQQKFNEKFLIFLLSALSIVIGSYVAARCLLLRPLTKLQSVIERSKSGEKGVRVPVWRHDEIGSLFESFNGFMQSSEGYRDVINAANFRLTALALKDELTGLFNRRAALQKFKDLKDERNISVIFIDVDHFKSINDLYGHDGGDALLRALAERISAHIDPKNATAYRIGGDEFIVLQEGLKSAQEAQGIANELLSHLSSTYSAKETEQDIAVSIGVYFCEDRLSSFDDVVAMASRALRSAKSTGRNRTVLLDQELRDEALERISLARSVQEALDCGSFVTYYQGRHMAMTGEIVGAEALSRCILPNKKIISPLQFMPIIEESHHSLDHGRILIAQVCEAAISFRKIYGESFRVSLNVNAHQLIHPEFWAFFARERKMHDLPTSAFEVEITESSLIQNFDVAHEVLQEFRQEGGLVALDDFGTGYSSLSYLTRLPIDIIKLDREFAASAVRDKRNAGILQATILIANSIGAQVVAEGIETIDEEIFMRAAGVNYLQGYRYSKPVPLIDALTSPRAGAAGTSRAPASTITRAV